MFSLSANLEYMFHEAGDALSQRIEMAAACGINKVEVFAVPPAQTAQVAGALEKHNVTLHTMLVDPRIMLVLEDTHDKFIETVEQTAQQAKALGCKHLVCGSGTGAPFLNRQASLAVVCKAIGRAAEVAEKHGLTLLLEAVNTRVDHPGVFFSHTSDTLHVAKTLNRDSVKVLYDIYHSLAEGEDVAATLEQAKDHIGHIQIADFPGRHEPGAGSVDWRNMLQLIKNSGYRGAIGVECYPSVATSQALQFIREQITAFNKEAV